MMSIHAQKFHYKRLDNLKTTVLELPYVGDRYSMFILLPDAIDGLTALESGLDAQSLDSAIQNLTHRRAYKLTMPRINIEKKLNLKESVKALGIQKLFGDNADLSGMFHQPGIFVKNIIQQAVIEISENGTRASVATELAFGGFLMSIPIPHFSINRPFMFVLRDKTIGVNLFYGRYTDPRIK
ncbi:serpin B3 [Patella vulgata]|uniref:serpin B3 n=1 Tax=Patella vulgata TaxID=6465 RepID=UPI0021809A48|nr:serpin B3 [Patella vulgata]